MECDVSIQECKTDFALFLKCAATAHLEAFLAGHAYLDGGPSAHDLRAAKE